MPVPVKESSSRDHIGRTVDCSHFTIVDSTEHRSSYDGVVAAEQPRDTVMHDGTNAVRSHYRWVIVAAGGVLGCVAIGGLFSLPVFLRPIAQDTGWSTTGISTAMTLAFVALALGSIAWGPLSDRVGPRVVVLAGSLLLTV